MATPETQYFPAERKTLVRFAGVDVVIVEDDAGYAHVTAPVEVATVTHGQSEVVNVLPDEATWQAEAEAKAPQKDIEAQVRDVVEAKLSPTSTQEDAVQLAVSEAIRLTTEQGKAA